MIKVSVIVPVYNVEKYLRECLDSLRNQTLKELEFICINDGSTDGSLEILNEYAKADSRFIIINQKNQGQGIARNKGLEIAQGEYIAFADPDDWLELHAFEELYRQSKLLKSEVLQFNYQEYNDYSGKFKEVNFAKKILHRYKYDLNKTPYFNIFDLRNNCFNELDLHVWARFYSRDFIAKSKAIFAPTKHGEDHLFANAVVLNAKQIHYINKSFYIYRCRAGSAVNIVSNDNFGIFENIRLFENYLKEILEDLNSLYSIIINQYSFWHCLKMRNFRRIHKAIFKEKHKDIFANFNIITTPVDKTYIFAGIKIRINRKNQKNKEVSNACKK